MSTYISKAKNPKTDEPQSAIFIDDYYGHHRYAVVFRKDSTDASIQDDISVGTHDIYPIEKIERKNSSTNERKIVDRDRSYAG